MNQRKRTYSQSEISYFGGSKLFIVIAIHLMISSCLALDQVEFMYAPNKKIATVIGANELNRIYLVGGEVLEVIGEESKYSLYWSGDWRNLFIHPKVEVGEDIEISLITQKEGAQDIRFTVGDNTAKTIFINLNKKHESKPVNTRSYHLTAPELRQEIGKMMRAMIDGETGSGKYYVRDLKRKLKAKKSLVINQDKSYRYGNLSGAVLKAKNLTFKPLDLTEADFKGIFQDTIAINLSSPIISPKGEVRVFIIAKAASDD